MYLYCMFFVVNRIKICAFFYFEFVIEQPTSTRSYDNQRRAMITGNFVYIAAEFHLGNPRKLTKLIV